MNKLYNRIYKDLVAHKNREKAEKDQKYHKYAGYHSLGIASPILDKLLKRYKEEIKNLPCGDIIALTEMLYKNKIEELTLVGNFILENKLDCLGKSQLSFLDNALEYLNSWSAIDDFCINILQPVIIKHPEDTLLLLKKWNKSKNMWKRRASVVAFVRKIGESGQFTKEALALCENLIWDKEDLVQKGVGWCLKDIMRGDKQRVLKYVETLRKQGVSATITLYAIRDLRGGERKKILKVRKNLTANQAS